jgi:hypothetical protein
MRRSNELLDDAIVYFMRQKLPFLCLQVKSMSKPILFRHPSSVCKLPPA